MERAYTEDQIFEAIDYSKKALSKADYENCRFVNCNFAETDLSMITFIDCVFDNCNLSAANINGTSFQETKFENCKLLGLHFENCNSFLFTVVFDHCLLNFSSFYKMNLKAFGFTSCSLQQVDFTGADLGAAVFHKCNLRDAMFDQTNLEKADLRTAINFSIDPESNKIKKAKFSLQTIAGLLHKYDVVIE